MNYDEMRKNIEQANLIEQHLHEEKRTAAIKRIKEMREQIRREQEKSARANTFGKIPQ